MFNDCRLAQFLSLCIIVGSKLKKRGGGTKVVLPFIHSDTYCVGILFYRIFAMVQLVLNALLSIP